MSAGYWSGVLPDIERLVLERVQMQVRALVAEEQIHLLRSGVEVDHVSRHIAGQLVYTLRSQALQHRCEPFEASARGSVDLVVPATWWQHWKADHAGSRWWGWIARRWPVRTATVTAYPMVAATFDKAALFPQPTFDYPDELGPVVLAITPTLEQRMTVTHEHAEYDPHQLQREYRDYKMAFCGPYHEVMSFSEWRADRDARLQRGKERARLLHQQEQWAS